MGLLQQRERRILTFLKGKIMNNLVSGKVMMSSLEIQQVIAELAKDEKSGVKEKEHKHILRDIKEQLSLNEGENHSPNLDHESYRIVKDYRGYISEILLNQEETEILITGYSTPIRRAVLKKLRDKIAELEAQPKLPTTYIEALKALVESEEAKQKALERVAVVEDQNAYQVKALVTSMSNNSKLTKKVKVLEAKVRGFEEYVSIHAYLAREKIKSWSSVTGYVSTNGLVMRLKKMGMENNEWALKQFEGQEYATTVFDVEFLDDQKEFIIDYIEKAIQKKSKEVKD